MKQLTAIWFSLLFVLAQIAPAAPAISKPNCCKAATARHAACCAQMPCCAQKSEAPSQPAPVVPAQNGRDTQSSLAAVVMAVWILPDCEPKVFSFTQQPPVSSADTPLYTRHCALLI